jgi:hypothetical protein
MKAGKQGTGFTVTDPKELIQLVLSKVPAARRAVARDPSSHPEVLDALSHDSDKATRRAVAGNPNAPASALMRLGAQFPNQLLENPALDAMAIENPNLFSEIPEATLTSIAKRESCSAEMLGHLAHAGHGKGLLMSLAQNGNTPSSAVRHLNGLSASQLAQRFSAPEDQMFRVKRLLGSHFQVRGDVDPEEAKQFVWQTLVERLLERDAGDIADLLDHADIPRRFKDDLIGWTHLRDGVAAACRTLPLPATLIEAIASQAGKRDLKLVQKCLECPAWIKNASTAEEARRAIQVNREASEKLWKCATESGSDALMLSLVGHPLAEGRLDVGRILDRLARTIAARGWLRVDGYADPRAILFICGHPMTSAETLRFIHDSLRVQDRPPLPVPLDELDTPIRRKRLERWVEEASRTPDELAAAAGRHSSVDYIIWRHPSVSPEVASRIRVALDLFECLGEHPNAPAELLQHLAAWGARSVAGNPMASEEVLRALHVTQPDCAVYLASNRAAPSDLLLKLAASTAEEVLLNLLGNPSTPSEALLKIARHKDFEQIFDSRNAERSLFNHPNLSGAVIDALIDRGLLDTYRWGTMLAKNEQLSVASYEELERDEYRRSVRKPLASNPAVPTHILERLASCEDESVRRAALRTLKRRTNGEAQ